MVRHGGGGGRVSAVAAIGNDIPRASRSAAAALFAWMEFVVRQQGGGCGDKGNNNGSDNGGEDVMALAVTTAGIGQHNESEGGGGRTR